MSLTPSRSVLLVGPDESVSLLPRILELDSAKSVTAEATGAVQEALDRIARKGYDAVVCWAEREDELAGVIRIRKASPATPILLLTSRKDRAFEGLARHMGATQISPKHRDLQAISKTIRFALLAGELAAELRGRTEEVRCQSRQVADLAAENRKLANGARSLVNAERRAPLVPLVVENDLDDALLMDRAFARAEIFTPLPILKNGEEAIAYLSEAARPESRMRLHFPSVVLLDINLPGKSGFDVLSWMRRQPELRRLPVVMLTASADPAHINRAYELGANSYLVKPTQFTALVELVSGLRIYWRVANLS